MARDAYCYLEVTSQYDGVNKVVMLSAAKMTAITEVSDCISITFFEMRSIRSSFQQQHEESVDIFASRCVSLSFALLSKLVTAHLIL